MKGSLQHRFLTWLLTTFAVFALGCSERQMEKLRIRTDDTASASGVYGADDRKDLYEITDSRLLALAEGTVALMPSRSLSEINATTLRIRTRSYARDYRLCSDEPFFEQETAAFCSGFLVSDDLIVTAGHCISNQEDCNSTKFVFNFSIKQKGDLPREANKEDVYSCREIVKTQGGPADLAIVRLDRKVSSASPLALRRGSMPGEFTPLILIGHPSGLPAKVASGGFARMAGFKQFKTSVDSYAGNSGSPVFNRNTGLVEGILVNGDLDFVRQGSCYISRVCAEHLCLGEGVVDIEEVIAYLP